MTRTNMQAFVANTNPRVVGGLRRLGSRFDEACFVIDFGRFES